jgi:cytoskeletal protein RodZ
MASTGIGERLRNARTARGLTLEDIEAATHIKRRFLDALEREAWDELPGTAYARGFLVSYAQHLGISTDEILSLYLVPSVRGPSVAAPRPVDVRITPANPQSRLRRIVTAIVVLLIAGAVALSYVLARQLGEFAASRPRPQASGPAPGAGAPNGSPPAGTQAGGTPGVTSTQPGGVTQTGAAGAVTGTAAVPLIAPGQPVVVTVQATDRTWVRATADGTVIFEGFVSAGDHEVWRGQHRVSLRVGNASALDLSVNGQPIGRLGNPGDVVERAFSNGTPATAPPASPPPAAPAPPRQPVPAAPPAAAPRTPAPAPAAPAPSAPVPIRPPSSSPAAPPPRIVPPAAPPSTITPTAPSGDHN